VKPKLLVLELWGLGDLAMATPFLQAATENFSVTLLAKPFAEELRGRLWPEVKVIPFNAPWTAFRGKYNLWRWPWIKMLPMQRQLAREKFDVGVSARWDPRDHFILWAIGARQRLGVSRLGSQCFLTNNLHRNPLAHHYNDWRELAINLGLNLPVREKLFIPAAKNSQTILVHTGAGQPVRVWPLQNFQEIVAHLRRENFFVQVACDSEQRAWWLRVGEKNVATPTTVTELISLTDRVGAFIGNDSGPGHLAAFCGVPTFTIFGPQLSEWFTPLHPAAEFFEGRNCPYKPCSDYCRFEKNFCLQNLPAMEVWPRIFQFAQKHLSTVLTAQNALT
jgi:ADP-heptose:LPS heptosyltransferase